MSLEIDRVRAFCAGRISEARGLEAQLGEAGASDELAVAATCQQLIDELDAMPALIAPVRIPDDTRKALADYAAHGLQPGHCLRAILAGDLFAALSRADYRVAAALPAIVAYIHDQLPAVCYGSEERVQRWLARPRP